MHLVELNTIRPNARLSLFCAWEIMGKKECLSLNWPWTAHWNQNAICHVNWPDMWRPLHRLNDWWRKCERAETKHHKSRTAYHRSRNIIKSRIIKSRAPSMPSGMTSYLRDLTGSRTTPGFKRYRIELSTRIPSSLAAVSQELAVSRLHSKKEKGVDLPPPPLHTHTDQG